MNFPWEKSSFEAEAAWRNFHKAHGEVGRKDCRLARFILLALDDGAKTVNATLSELYR
jgi:hypothetical protein